MKEKCIAFVLTAVIALTLAGCGEKDRPHQNGQSSVGSDITTPTDAENNKPDTQTDKPGTQTDTPNERFDSTQDMGKTSEKTKIDNTISGTQAPAMTARGYVKDASHERTWSQMVDNGRVHDRDGDLLDGENSHW